MMIEFEYLLRVYDTWLVERDELVEREDSGDPPRSSEWQRSDDFAFNLLADFAAKARGET
jgi:hypothetical protein